MKHRVKFNIGEVTVPEIGLNVKDVIIEVEGEAQLNELTGIVALVKDTVKETVEGLPELLVGLKKGFDKFQEIEEQMNPNRKLEQDELGTYYKQYVRVQTEEGAE